MAATAASEMPNLDHLSQRIVGTMLCYAPPRALWGASADTKWGGVWYVQGGGSNASSGAEEGGLIVCIYQMLPLLP